MGVLWKRGVFTTLTDRWLPSGTDNVQSGADSPRDRLVGQWEYLSSSEARMNLDVHKDGTLVLTGINKGNMVVENATWEVLSEKKDRLTIRLQFTGRPKPSEWDVELLPNEEMRVNFLTSTSAPVTYKRKR
jgi:hypothetical protein